MIQGLTNKQELQLTKEPTGKLEGKDKSKVKSVLTNITSISDLSSVLEDGKTLVIASPMDPYQIHNRKFKDRTDTLLSIRREGDKFYSTDLGTFHNVESFIRGRGRVVSKNTFGFSHSEIEESRVLSSLKYNATSNSNMFIIDTDSSPFIDKSVKHLSEGYEEISNLKKDVNKLLSEKNVTSQYYDKDSGKEKKLNNDLVIRNLSSGSDVLYFSIDGQKYSFGGTHQYLTSSRVSSERGDLNWSDLRWSNYSPSNGYNKEFSISKLSVKERRELLSKLQDMEKKSSALNSEKTKFLSKYFEGMKKKKQNHKKTWLRQNRFVNLSIK